MPVTLKLNQVCVGTRTFVCRYVPHNMSNKRFHWAVKKKWTDAWKEEVGNAVMLERRKFGKLPLAYASIIIILKTCRLMDYDGAYSCVKPLLDGLKGILIIDDSPKYINLQVKQIKVGKIKDQGVQIIIE